MPVICSKVVKCDLQNHHSSNIFVVVCKHFLRFLLIRFPATDNNRSFLLDQNSPIWWGYRFDMEQRYPVLFRYETYQVWRVMHRSKLPHNLSSILLRSQMDWNKFLTWIIHSDIFERLLNRSLQCYQGWMVDTRPVRVHASSDTTMLPFCLSERVRVSFFYG